MPRTVYSKHLWTAGNGGVTTPILGPGPAAGFVWVVRDIVAYNPAPGGIPLTGFVLTDDQEGIIAGVGQPEVMPNHLFHWDCHQVLSSSPLERLVLQCNDDGWWLRVSGYELTLP